MLLTVQKCSHKAHLGGESRTGSRSQHARYHFKLTIMQQGARAPAGVPNIALVLLNIDSKSFPA